MLTRRDIALGGLVTVGFIPGCACAARLGIESEACINKIDAAHTHVAGSRETLARADKFKTPVHTT
jgi:hypothetical protein